ncbi:MAG: hypothetical protein M1834_008960 [Cirrosporium novae-zelandiae]|nr:MAG: hypothetical protein M1834_008960 [Cirrosporium novae-zelandiae]
MFVITKERLRSHSRHVEHVTYSYPRSYTVKRYMYPEEEDRISDRINALDLDRDRTKVKETRLVRREEPDPDREITRILRREPEPDERDVVVSKRYYDEDDEVDRDVQLRRYETEREVGLGPGRYERENRYDREDAPARDDIQRYTRQVEYYDAPDTRPIVIRPAPQQIIIQEAPPKTIYIDRDESDYQVVRREDAEEERQVVRRKPKEDYVYEKRTREVERDGRREDDFYDERRYRDRRGRARSVSSDGSMVYVRKEYREEYDSDYDSPRHRRHLAEGAIAGIGAAELLRHRKKGEGEEVSGGAGRIGRDVAAATIGAVGVEAIKRAKSRHRSRSRRTRSLSSERGYYREKRRHKHRHHSRSRSRARQLAGLGLGAAAIAAAVYANKQKKKAADEERRSRSRTRRDSVSVDSESDTTRSSSRRNKRIAEAGLGGAAIAGLIERARSRSKSKSKSRHGRSRSRSKIRQALPVVATGLGSAAVAGLYEKQKDKKRDKEKRRRSKSRSRSRSVYYDGPRHAAASDPGLIEYGDQPVYAGYANNYVRPASQAGFYDNGTVVPSRHREKSVSRDKHYASDSGTDRSSRRRHRRRRGSESRSRSRGKDIATGAAAAGAAALAAHEYEKRKERKKEKDQKRHSHSRDHRSHSRPRTHSRSRERDPYEENFDPRYTPSPPLVSGGAGYPPTTGQYYPQTNAFPPPPTAAQPQYNPAEYPPPPGAAPPNNISYDYPPSHEGYGPPNQDPYAPRVRRADENVSATPNANVVDEHLDEEGLKTPTQRQSPRPKNDAQLRSVSQPAPAGKNVQFDLGDSDSSSPDPGRGARRRDDKRGYESGDSDSTLDHDDRSQRPKRHHRHHHHYRKTPAPGEASSRRSAGQEKTDKGHKSEGDSDEPSSESTVDLPPRFDEHGHKMPDRREDPLADQLENLLTGNFNWGSLLGSRR